MTLLVRTMDLSGEIFLAEMLAINLYAHALPENDQRAANLMGNLLSSEPTEANTQELEKSVQPSLVFHFP